MLLAFFTDIPMDEIKTMCKSDIVAAKRRMAFEITKLIHGEDVAKAAADTAMSLFGGGGNAADMPTAEIKMKSPMGVLDFLCASGLFTSKSEARRNVEQGGIQIDGKKITDPKTMIAPSDEMTVQKGKKVFLRVICK